MDERDGGSATESERRDSDRGQDGIDRLARFLREADVAAALTGAGVSTASGIPSFRGEDGVWGSAFDPADFRAGRLRRDPAGFWADRIELRERMRPDGVAPNAAHEGLATLQKAGDIDAVITQNTDGIHAAAGTPEVIELHGSAGRVRCASCDRRQSADPVFERARDGELPPTCGECGGILRPDVVLFGEGLPEADLARAQRLARESDLFLAIGSSLTVRPAASLPATAAREGRVGIVNFEATPHDDRADVIVRADVTDVVPALVERVE